LTKCSLCAVMQQDASGVSDVAGFSGNPTLANGRRICATWRGDRLLCRRMTCRSRAGSACRRPVRILLPGTAGAALAGIMAVAATPAGRQTAGFASRRMAFATQRVAVGHRRVAVVSRRVAAGNRRVAVASLRMATAGLMRTRGQDRIIRPRKVTTAAGHALPGRRRAGRQTTRWCSRSWARSPWSP
jgi:hypothetical protein